MEKNIARPYIRLPVFFCQYFAQRHSLYEGKNYDETIMQNTCIMRIQVDHMFTKNFKKCKNGKQNPNCPVDREEVLAFISSHIKAINSIYIKQPFFLKEGGRTLLIRPRFQVLFQTTFIFSDIVFE